MKSVKRVAISSLGLRIFVLVIISSHEPKAQGGFSDQNMFTAHRCWGHCCCKLSTFLYSSSIGLISIKHGTKHTVLQGIQGSLSQTMPKNI